MIDKMPLVNIHNKKKYFGRKICCSKSGKIWVLTKENKNHFRLAQNLSGNFSPGFPDPKIFCPTFYGGSNKRCYIVPTRTERKNAQTSKISSQWCLSWRKISGSKLRLFWVFWMVLCRELKIFHGKFNLKKRKTSYKYMSRSGFQFSSNWFPGIFARIWRLPELPEVGKMEGMKVEILVILCAQLQNFFFEYFSLTKKRNF